MPQGSRTNAHLHLIRKGKYAKVIKYVLPRVETFTLSSGWDDGKVAAFAQAIEQVVVENPILTSHLVWKKNALYASLGTYTTKNHTFVKIEKDPSIVVETDLVSYKGQLDFINDCIAPMVGSTKKVLASDDIKTMRPLFHFHAHLFQFANGRVCYYTGVSHALVDGRTYYQIIDQISSFMNQEDILSHINWGNPELTTLDIYPDHLTKRDRRSIGLLPLFLGFLHSGKRKKEQICEPYSFRRFNLGYFIFDRRFKLEVF